MNITAGEVAAALGAALHGDSSIRLSSIKPLESAEKTDISFLTLPRERDNRTELLQKARESRAGALLVAEYFEEFSSTQIVTPDPMRAVIMLASRFYRAPRDFEGIDPRAVVHPSAVLGANVAVGPLAVVGANVVLGDNTVVYPHAVIYPHARLGKNCVIHSGAVIREFVTLGDDCLIQPGVALGGDGFGYLPDKELGYRRIPHIGTLELADGVDVGANSAIDRATLGKTSIGRSTKIDNLVQIGHNVAIGERTVICGLVGIAGSSKIGNDVTLAGQVGVGDHSVLGDKSRYAAKAGAAGKYEPGKDYAGMTAFPASDWRRSAAAFRSLPELARRVKNLEKKLNEVD